MAADTDGVRDVLGRAVVLSEDDQPACLTTVDEMQDTEVAGHGDRRMPKYGGRLRAFRADWGRLGTIRSEFDPEMTERFDTVVYHAEVLGAGRLLGDGTGTCDGREFDDRETQIEMAQTRAKARALRDAGYGVDGVSAEEDDQPDTGGQKPSRAQMSRLKNLVDELDNHGLGQAARDIVDPEQMSTWPATAKEAQEKREALEELLEEGGFGD